MIVTVLLSTFVRAPRIVNTTYFFRLGEGKSLNAWQVDVLFTVTKINDYQNYYLQTWRSSGYLAFQWQALSFCLVL